MPDSARPPGAGPQRDAATELGLLRTLARLAGIGAWQIDLTRDLALWTDEIYRIFEVEPAEMTTTVHSMLAFIDPSPRAELTAAIDRAIDQGSGWDMELPARTAQRHPIWVRIIGEAQRQPDGSVLLVGTCEDVTSVRSQREALRARTEEARKLAAVAETSSSLVLITDAEDRIEWVNDSFTRVTGYTLLDAVGRRPSELLHDPDSDSEYGQLQARGRSGPSNSLELQLRRKDGQPYWAIVEVHPVHDDDGTLLHLICTQTDVTERRLAEQRAIEAGDWLAIARSAAGIGFFYKADDEDDAIIDPQARRILGLAPDERDPSPDEYLEMVLPQDRERFIAARSVEPDKPLELEYRIRRKGDGAVRWLRALSVRLPASSQGPARIVGAVLDVTDVRRSDRHRRLLAERLELASTAHDIGLWDIEPDTGAVNWNDQMLALYGVTPEEAPKQAGEWLERFVFGGDHERVLEAFKAVSGGSRRVEHRIVRGDGSLRWLESQSTERTSDDGRRLILGTSSDITERKESEQRLREALQRLELATERARVGVFTRDAKTGAGYWNPQLFRLYGLPESPQAPPASKVLARVHPEDRAKYNASWQQAIHGEEFDDIQLRVILPDGGMRWLLIRGRREASGGVRPRVAGVVLDITDQKQAEERAAASAAWLKLATESSGIGTWSRDLRSGDGMWDRQMFALMGCPPGAAPRREAMVELVHPEDRAIVHAAWEQMQQVQHPVEYEYRVPRPDGSVAHINTRGVVERDEQGRPLRAIGTAIDVTASRAAQRRLREFDEWMQLASAATGVGFFRLGLDDSTQYADRQMRVLYGYDPNGPAPSYEQFLQAILPEDRERVISARGQSKSSDEPVEAEYRVRGPDGMLRQIFTRRVLLRDEHGAPLHVVGAAIDVTTSRSVQAALHAANQRLALAQRTAGIGIWEWDFETNEMRVDESIRTMLGVPADWIPDFDTWLALVHPDDAERARAIYEEALPSTAVEGRSEYRVLRPDGSVRHVDERFTIQRDAAGRPVRLLGTNLDITHIRRTESERATLFDRLQLASQTAKMGVWERRTPDDSEVWNEQMHALYGTDPATHQPSRSDWIARIHPDDRAEVLRRLVEFEGQDGGELEYRIVRSDGEIRHVADRFRAERDDSGVVLRKLGVHLDITEIRRAERERDELSRRMQMVANAIGLGVWEWMPQQHRSVWNDQMYVLFGSTREALERRTWLDVVHSADRPQAQAAMNAALATGDSFQLEFRVLWPDDSVHWLATRARISRDSGGRAIQMLGVTWDITERKLAETALNAKEAAERASQAKSEFLSRMSHELRTPLNAILGFTQILEIDRAQPLTAVQQDRVDHIKQAGWHLLTLINEILDLSRIEAGATNLNMAVVPVVEVIDECVALVKADVARRQLSLEVVQQPGAPTGVWADRTRMKQVLLNLLSNAVKYNRDGGSITVEVRADRNGAAEIGVRDTGPGLTPAQMDKLFQPFNRLGLESAPIEGTGIGLTIAKKLVEQMGGSIGVSSEPGTGSEFRVTLQTASAHAADAAAHAAQQGGVTKERTDVVGSVLCVEDNAANFAVVEAILRLRPNVSLLKATDGAAARVLAAVCQPDLILVDMRLPDTDGLSLHKALRHQRETAEIPCVALSANALPSDVAAARGAGFVDYLTKPLVAAELLRTIDQALGRRH